jgi:hypothetical protein
LAIIGAPFSFYSDENMKLEPGFGESLAGYCLVKEDLEGLLVL